VQQAHRKKKGNPPEGEPENHSLGRSRGGWGTKIHAICDKDGNGLNFCLTPGQSSDIAYAEWLIELTSIPKSKGRPRTRPNWINADKGYDSQDFRTYLSLRQTKANIPEQQIPKGKTRRRKGRKPTLNEERYKNRNQIERLFGKLKHFRRIATRYDKYAQVFLAFIYLAIIIIYIKKYFSNTT